MLARRPRRSTRTGAQATASHARRMILWRSTPLNTSSSVPKEPSKNYDFEQSETADYCLNVWARLNTTVSNLYVQPRRRIQPPQRSKSVQTSTDPHYPFGWRLRMRRQISSDVSRFGYRVC